MSTIESLKLHVKSLSKSTKNSLYSDLTAFLDTNKGFQEDELLKMFYEKYGTRLNLIESIVNTRNTKCIREWMDIFGYAFIISVFLTIVYFIAIMK